MKFAVSLARALVGAAILLSQQTVHAQAPKDAFVIGGVVPLSGAYALLGTSMQKGVDLAVEQRGKWPNLHGSHREPLHAEIGVG